MAVAALAAPRLNRPSLVTGLLQDGYAHFLFAENREETHTHQNPSVLPFGCFIWAAEGRVVIPATTSGAQEVLQLLEAQKEGQDKK